MNMKSCDDCALQYTEACPDLYGNSICSKFAWKPQFDPQRWKPRQRPDEGEYLDEPAGPGISHEPISSFQQYDSDSIRLYVGQRLFYWDRFTGGVKHGNIMWLGTRHFGFAFGKAKARLEYPAIGTRLFLTPDGAMKLGRKREGYP